MQYAMLSALNVFPVPLGPKIMLTPHACRVFPIKYSISGSASISSCIPNDNLFAILANLETMVILLPRRRWNSDNRAPVIKQWMVRFCIDIVCLPEIFFVAIYAYPAQCSGYITVNTRELVDFLQGWRWIVNSYAACDINKSLLTFIGRLLGLFLAVSVFFNTYNHLFKSPLPTKLVLLF